MKFNLSTLVLIGAASLAVAMGVTLAVKQTPQVPPIAVESPTPVASPADVEVPAATSTATAATMQAAEQSPPNSSPSASPEASPVSRKVELCTVRMAVANDPQPPLNVRSAPNSNGENVVGQVKNGTLVTVVDEQDGWLQISTPMRGWVAKNRTDHGCNQKVERISLADDLGTVSISDRFVGTGNHRYVMNASQGQTVTITRDHGPFPSLIAPDGTRLVDGMMDEKRESWTGKLAQTGTYTVELSSNFRGYRYSFLVEVK
jgi:hypothetical protein